MMQQHRLRFGVAMLVIVVAFSAPTVPGDGEGEIVMLSESELSALEAKPLGPAPSYQKIPGFRFSFKSIPAKVDGRGPCEQICSSQPTCKPYSYSVKLRKCQWSTERMKYDPDFVFNSKPKSGESYTEFPGLVFQATGWLKAQGKTNADCAAMCNKAAACAAYSYRGRDKLCLLSGKGIGFHADYNYYEKRGLGHKDFGLRPKNARKVKKAKVTTPAPAPNAGASKAQMLNAAVKAAKAAATTKTIIKQTGEPDSVVAERLRQVKKWAAEKIKKKEEEEKLKLKASEIDNKAKLDKQKGADEKREAKEKIAQNKARAEREAARRTAAAKEKAAAMVQKVRQEAKAAGGEAMLSQAAAEARAARVTVETAQKQVKKIKEVDAKKHKLRVKEIAEKQKQKANEDEQLKLVKEKDAKTYKARKKTAVTEENAKVTKSFAKKAKETFEKTSERHEKVVVKEQSRKKTRKMKMTLDKELAVKADVEKKKALAELNAANKKTAAARLKEQKEKKMSKVEEKKAKEMAKNKIKLAEIEAKKKTKEKEYKKTLAANAKKEKRRKGARVKKDSEKAAKEAAAKSGTGVCKKKIAKMRQDAYNAEKAVAASASKVKPAEKGDKLLEKEKQKWRKKITDAREKCSPKSTKFSVDSRPISTSDVAVRKGKPDPAAAKAGAKARAAANAIANAKPEKGGGAKKPKERDVEELVQIEATPKAGGAKD